MAYHNLFDSHTHSDNSHDAHHSVMYMAEHAEQHGLMGIAVTDHAESPEWKASVQRRIVQSVVDAAKAAEAFRNRMSVMAGVEVGLSRDLSVVQHIVGLYPFDFVLGSVHHASNGEDLYEVDYAALGEAGVRGLMDDYFSDMLFFVRWGGFDSLSHMTFPLRSAKSNSGLDIDLRLWAGEVDEVLRALVEKGVALECNSSGLRSAIGETMPPSWVLARYRELGGELVTIGSDAHRAEQLGSGIGDCMELLEGMGFRYFTFYRGRKPVMLRIV